MIKEDREKSIEEGLGLEVEQLLTSQGIVLDLILFAIEFKYEFMFNFFNPKMFVVV
jgi:hypothetical protein